MNDYTEVNLLDAAELAMSDAPVRARPRGGIARHFIDPTQVACLGTDSVTDASISQAGGSAELITQNEIPGSAGLLSAGPADSYRPVIAGRRQL